MSADISVSGSGGAFTVSVAEDGSSTTHRVTLQDGDYERLTKATGLGREELIRRSFKFLLAREPKESILSSFDLMVIARYFPEYEETISRPA
jgi:hypothetical protein